MLSKRDANVSLFVAYAWIAILLVATWFIGNLPYGVLAVPPLLIIAACGRRLVAVITAIILGPLNVYLDRVVPPRFVIPAGFDQAITLTVILVGVIFVADAMRKQGQYFEFRLNRAEADAVRDVITQMPNRRAFEKQLKNAIESANDRDKVAVLFADLDGFKEINDTLGHDVGDMALAAAADRLAHALRDTDFVARVGGDEFGIIVPRLRERDDIDRVIRGIEGAFSTPFNVNLNEVNLGISVGSSVYPDDANTSRELLTLADEHMYASKRSRRDPTS